MYKIDSNANVLKTLKERFLQEDSFPQQNQTKFSSIFSLNFLLMSKKKFLQENKHPK